MFGLFTVPYCGVDSSSELLVSTFRDLSPKACNLRLETRARRDLILRSALLDESVELCDSGLVSDADDDLPD